MARAIRNAIRANRFARIIRNLNPYFYSASGRFGRITRISDSRESPDSRESCESIRANHATKVQNVWGEENVPENTLSRKFLDPSKVASGLLSRGLVCRKNRPQGGRRTCQTKGVQNSFLGGGPSSGFPPPSFFHPPIASSFALESPKNQDFHFLLQDPRILELILKRREA